MCVPHVGYLSRSAWESRAILTPRVRVLGQNQGKKTSLWADNMWVHSWELRVRLPIIIPSPRIKVTAESFSVTLKVKSRFLKLSSRIWELVPVYRIWLHPITWCISRAFQVPGITTPSLPISSLKRQTWIDNLWLRTGCPVLTDLWSYASGPGDVILCSL